MPDTFVVSQPTIDLPASLMREIGRTMVLSVNIEFRLSRIAYALLGIDRKAGRIAVREPRVVERFDIGQRIAGPYGSKVEDRPH